VFLALAVGIVVGTTALNGPVLEGLRERNAGLISEKRGLESDVRALEAEVDTADALVRELGRDLVGGELDGARVLLVVEPGVEGRVLDQLAAVVDEAGGSVTGRLQLQPALLEPASSQLVEDLAAQVLPAGVQLPAGSALARAGSLLGAALLDRPGTVGVDADSAQQVVSAFGEAGLVELQGVEGAPPQAGLAVLVAAAAPAEQDPARRAALDGLVSLAAELRARAEGLVLAGSAEANVEGGLVRAVRNDAGVDSLVSTVDNADRAVGQVAVVLALVEQAAGGSGRYGGGQGATGPVPVPQAAEEQPEADPAAGG
jgi:hypothetical protein